MRWMRCWLSCVLSLICTVAWAEPKNLYNTETPVTARCVSADGLTFESCGGGGGTGGDGAINDGVSSAIKATVFDYTNSNPLGVVLRDTNGDYVSVGGGTQYNQGTAATDTDVLTMMGCVRSDTAAVATGVIDGDRARCIVDSTGRLWTFAAQSGTWTVTQSGTWNIGTVTTLTGITNPVTVTQGTGTNLHVVCDSGCSSSAGFSDNSAFTFGATAVNPIAGVLDDTATNTATENSAAVARITAQKGLHVNLRSNGGTELASATTTPSGSALGLVVRNIPSGTQTVSGTVAVSSSSPDVNAPGGVSISAVSQSTSVTLSAYPSSGTALVEITGTWSGTLQFELQGYSSSSWTALSCASSTTVGQTTTSNGLYFCPAAGAGAVRVVSTAWTSGTATVVLSAVASTNGVLLTSPLPPGSSTVGGVTLPQYTPVSGRLPVDGSGVTQPVSGTVTANVGTFPDNEPFNVAQYGGSAVGAGNALHVQPGTGANFTTTPGGNVAHGAADSGNPIKVGCQARTTNRTAEADADRVDCVADKNGQIVVTPMAPRDRVVRSGVITLTTTTETTLIAAGGAGVFRDLTYLKCTNSSATLTRVDLRDATAGTVIDSWALAANGGGFNLAFSVPYAQATANNNWTVQLSGAVTDVRCSAQAVEKN